ncbi:hypothetical protein [Plantactinospora endophytica]|uniref:Uncharacterized protein n=1 Tax=Plantactinospora endophytica TaxID=673535 RepID=A0ABQ4E2L3_9ACTN|nr:hypothetical protein [Plantactinospora endophytica]GIG88953.1 hypothetical protein Pen02_38890 [Plantactinospora endophytica]
MPDRELKLNSVSRYAKESPLFILEEHGHCEVPAGCGGVVLRWRDPLAGVPLRVQLYAAGECRFLLDGVEPPSARPVVPYGEHVLAFTVADVDPAFIALMFAAVHRPGHDPHVDSTPEQAVEISILSTVDGGWRWSPVEPADDRWTRPGFDDGDWAPMEPRTAHRPPEGTGWDQAGYQVGRLGELGAVGLGVPVAADRIWVRAGFRLTPPGGTR